MSKTNPESLIQRNLKISQSKATLDEHPYDYFTMQRKYNSWSVSEKF